MFRSNAMEKLLRGATVDQIVDELLGRMTPEVAYAYTLDFAVLFQAVRDDKARYEAKRGAA